MSNELLKEEIKFEKESHWTTQKWYTTMYVNKKLGIYKQVDVHRDSFGFPTNKTRETFFIGKGRTEYKTLAAALSNLKPHSHE